MVNLKSLERGLVEDLVLEGSLAMIGTQQEQVPLGNLSEEGELRDGRPETREEGRTWRRDLSGVGS